MFLTKPVLSDTGNQPAIPSSTADRDMFRFKFLDVVVPPMIKFMCCDYAPDAIKVATRVAMIALSAMSCVWSCVGLSTFVSYKVVCVFGNLNRLVCVFGYTAQLINMITKGLINRPRGQAIMEPLVQTQGSVNASSSGRRNASGVIKAAFFGFAPEPVKSVSRVAALVLATTIATLLASTDAVFISAMLAPSVVLLTGYIPGLLVGYGYLIELVAYGIKRFELDTPGTGPLLQWAPVQYTEASA